MSHKKSPFLAGKKVSLRSLLAEDLGGNYFRWFNDQATCRLNSHGRYPNSESKMESFFAHASTSKNDVVLAIVENGTGAHVGNVSLQNIQWIDRTAEFAIILGEESARGKGYSKEAAELIVRHGFQSLNLNRIYCGTSEDNTAMQKLAAHIGMKEEGRRRKAMFKGGAYRDVLEYGILREEFKA